MKKNFGVSYLFIGKWTTIRMCLVTVKIISFLLVISLMSVYGKSYSQYVSVDLKRSKLTDLFDAIQEQSEFIFFYKDNLVTDKQISISVQNENIVSVLDRALRKQGLGYSISGKQITIKEQQPVQQRTITGKVTDGEGLYLAGVNVLVKGSNVGTTTDGEGDYELTIADDVTLIFSMVGYRPVEVNTKGQHTINAVLEEESRSIEEVVVVGYNAVERQHIASSIAQLDMRNVKSRPIVKLQEAFSGTLSGVTVMQTSNMPGDAPGPIQVRGISTLQNAEPLVIVDGMEQSLSDIDPNQIKSISVLKDAASASMYGSRGANGVIIIETERGETGQFKVDLHAWSALSKPIDLPDFVDAAEYMLLNNEARTLQGQTPVYTAEDLSNAEQGLSPNVDWLDVVMERPAMSHNTSANISGGGGVGTFNLMLGYTQENGLNAGEGTDKFSARFNTNINIADKFVLLADFYAHRLQVDRLYANDDGHGLYKRTWWTNPTQAVYYPDSELPDHFMLHNNENPLARIRHGGYQNNMHDRSTINLRPRYYITPNLHIDGNVSYMINKSAEKYKRETFKFFDGDGKPVTTWTNAVGSSQGVSVSQITARATVNYEQNLRRDQDKLYLLAGTETMNNTYTDYREIAKASFFGKLNYAFADRYLLELTARADGSSKFAPGNRWGFFPSGAIAWNLHNESFLSDVVERGIINNFKIRVSYGLIGNENVDPYLWQEVVNTWGWTMRVPNLDFSWEKQQQGNLGIDLTMLDNRLNFTGEIYRKHSYDLIYSNFPVPPLTGSYYLESSVNIGEVENKGWELSANWSDQMGNVSYTVGGMLFDNTNRVLKAGYSSADTLIFKDNNDKIWYRGIALDNYYGYQSNGYFNSVEEVNNTTAKLPNTIPGDIRYVDQNGDGVINDGDKINLGDPFPHLNYAINLSASYRKWDFSLLGQGVGRRTGRLNGMEGYPVLVDGADNNLGSPRVEYAENRWTPGNPDSRFPRVWTGASSNAVLSDVWLSDASFFRIKMLQLGYTFSGAGKSLRNIRIYVNAQDAITFTKWEGLEPERDGGDGSYPRMAVYSLGLKATIL
ncbi:SusC/RagA family TonB-linked outer membrane protein [Parapedobacter pyrenivorans]|nr:SusC/RagA family TonB-linked outer membrane protein [Parapedobacter pyrenivorans]